MEISKKGIVLSLISLLLLIGLINSASAQTIYPGDSKIINLSEKFDYYSIVGNSTPIDLTVINLTEDWLIINMTINKYQQSSNFTIVFFNKEKGEIEKVPVYSGGGGGSTKYVDRNVTIEVPKFYDKNITVYEENKITEEKIIYDDNKVTLSNILRVLTMIFGFVIGSIILMYVYFRLKNNERGYKKEYE